MRKTRCEVMREITKKFARDYNGLSQTEADRRDTDEKFHYFTDAKSLNPKEYENLCRLYEELKQK